MARILGEISIQPDADSLADIELPIELKAGFARDDAAAAVGPDEILAANFVLALAQAIAYSRRDRLPILSQIDQLRVEANLRAMPQRGFEDDGFQLMLRDIAHRARTGAFIVGYAIDPRSPRHRPRQFQPGKRRRENLGAHDVLWHRRLAQTALDAEVPQHLDRSLIGDMGARRIGRSTVLGDAYGVYAGPGQERGCRESGRAGADNKYIRFDQLHRP